MNSNFKSLFFVFFLIGLISIGNINSKGITSEIKDFDKSFSLNYIEKVYEISPSKLEKGHLEILNEKDAFRINFLEKDYYIITWEILQEVKIILSDERESIIKLNQSLFIDLNQDGKLDIKLILNSIEDFEGKKSANIFIKEFLEEELIPEGDYLELFDVTVKLSDYVIYDTKNLNAFIEFENFGEGPSQIEIIYSIRNENGKELYRGVDSKIVFTQDSVVKNFYFLDLDYGKYTLKTEIFYGDDQRGESEEGFEIIKKSMFLILKDFLIFIALLVSLLMLVIFFKKKVNLRN